jgi:N-acetylmuramoyl-L-alanine amidase
MRRRIAILLLALGLTAACGGGATPTPEPTPLPTPAPTDIFVESPEPTPVPTTPAATPVSGTRYRVKKGDTMWAIAQRYGITVAALQAANPGVDPRAMRVGTVLVIPKP